MTLEQLKSDLIDHGEIHMVVEEYSGEIEARLGQTTFSVDDGLIHISGPDYTLHINIDSVISWYKPVEVFENGD